MPSLANVAVANFDKHRLQLELVYNMASKIDNYLRANQLDLRIWPPFGDLDDFQELLDEMHKRRMKLINRMMPE